MKEKTNDPKKSNQNVEEVKDVGEKGSQNESTPDIDTTDEQLQKLKIEYTDLNDKYLRSLAEYDNFRKRTAKEREKMFPDAVSFVVKGFLDVFDNFQRALQCETSDAEFKKGFEMISTSFSEVFTKLGVEEIKTQGQSFSPLLHNAVLHVEDDSYAEGEIVETLQKGYKIGDNVIRYAMVKVAN